MELGQKYAQSGPIANLCLESLSQLGLVKNQQTQRPLNSSTAPQETCLGLQELATHVLFPLNTRRKVTRVLPISFPVVHTLYKIILSDFLHLPYWSAIAFRCIVEVRLRK